MPWVLHVGCGTTYEEAVLPGSYSHFPGVLIVPARQQLSEACASLLFMVLIAVSYETHMSAFLPLLLCIFCNNFVIFAAILEGNQQVIADVVRIGSYEQGNLPVDPQEFANRLLHTVYMGTENRWLISMAVLSLLGWFCG